MEEGGVEAARENFDFFGGDAAVDPAAAVVLGIHVDEVHLGVKPVHVNPGEGLEEAVIGEDADVLRKIGVINAAGAQAEHLRGDERDEAHGAGRAR